MTQEDEGRSCHESRSGNHASILRRIGDSRNFQTVASAHVFREWKLLERHRSRIPVCIPSIVVCRFDPRGSYCCCSACTGVEELLSTSPSGRRCRRWSLSASRRRCWVYSRAASVYTSNRNEICDQVFRGPTSARCQSQHFQAQLRNPPLDTMSYSTSKLVDLVVSDLCLKYSFASVVGIHFKPSYSVEDERNMKADDRFHNMVKW